MRLYTVEYSTWNSTFSELIWRHMLSGGFDTDEAIYYARELAPKDARDFKATEVEEVMGFSIHVGAPVGEPDV